MVKDWRTITQWTLIFHRLFNNINQTKNPFTIPGLSLVANTTRIYAVILYRRLFDRNQLDELPEQVKLLVKKQITNAEKMCLIDQPQPNRNLKYKSFNFDKTANTIHWPTQGYRHGDHGAWPQQRFFSLQWIQRRTNWPGNYYAFSFFYKVDNSYLCSRFYFSFRHFHFSDEK